MAEGRETEGRAVRERPTAPGPIGPPRVLLRRIRAACSRWWTARTVRFRKVTRTLVLLAVTGLASLCVGVVTATASSPVGPHQAQWSTTLDSTVSLDLGPLGQVALDSPAGILGVRVVLGEVAGQAEPVVGSQDALGEALSSDGAAYISLITHPELTIERGLRALADDALRRAGLLESIVLCLVAAGRLATGGRLRDAVRRALARPAASGLLTATGVVTVVALLVPALRSEAVTGQRLPVLAGTPLEQARLSGRIGDIAQAYGGRVTTFLADNTSFYAAAHANLWAAWAASERVDGVTDVTAVDGVVDADQVARAAASASPAGTSGAPSRGPSTAAAPGSSPQPPTTAEPAHDQGAVTAVLTTDLHCNLDVTAFAGLLDTLAGATVHMDDGDLTMTGSDPEQVCVDALSQAVPDGVSRVATIGNHDSAATAARLTAQGWTVTDGTVHQVGGLRVLGDTDPDRTTATGTTARGQEDVQALGARLAATSCRAPTDVVLVHQPAAFGPLAATGCAPLLIGGHLHSEQGLSATAGGRGTVLELVAGAGKGGTSIGAVTEDSYAHVLSFSRDGALLAWRTVVLHPDASVTVTTWQDVPTPS